MRPVRQDDREQARGAKGCQGEGGSWREPFPPSAGVARGGAGSHISLALHLGSRLGLRLEQTEIKPELVMKGLGKRLLLVERFN